jgi:hypothetical protein
MAEKFDDNKKVKVLAYFLPQFHTIPENDEWWGKGFTEWTTIRKENKVSENLQPLNDNYYNLLDEKTVLWQTELAETYGVYGFVYYHYYFCGKKLLEKPAENLLKWDHINQNFCFCWANHTWYRSWEGSKEVLIEQEYGDEEDWQKHFDYLKIFFTDKRYIKIENKPVFILLNDFKQKDNVINYFDMRCRNIGFNGIYIIESKSKLPSKKKISKVTEAIILREPDTSYSTYIRRNYFLRLILKLDKLSNNGYNSIKTFNMRGVKAEKIFNISLKYFRRFRFIKKCYPGVFAMWDNTYRHNERGFKIHAPSQEIFIYYLNEIKKICKERNLDFVFFNAWNEWAEGMTLEPSNIHKYRFLEGIKEVFGGN